MGQSVRHRLKRPERVLPLTAGMSHLDRQGAAKPADRVPRRADEVTSDPAVAIRHPKWKKAIVTTDLPLSVFEEMGV